MQDLPIILGLAEVDLVGYHDGETGVRWTLGPTWYDEHKSDEMRLPYFEDGDRTVETSIDVPARVKTWAEQMITSTTDYRVTGWNSLVPTLDLEQHILEIWTTSSVRATYTVNASGARVLYGRLGDPNCVFALLRADGQTAHIPCRAITTVNSRIVRTAVPNE